MVNIIKEKDKKISKLNSIIDIKNTLNYWKDNFDKLMSFLSSKLHNWYDKYVDIVNDRYQDDILDNEDLEELDLSKEKDDFER